MFFMILGTYRKQTFIDFSLTQRIQLMIFWCHTVTHGTDLRRSPHIWISFVVRISKVRQCWSCQLAQSNWLPPLKASRWEVEPTCECGNLWCSGNVITTVLEMEELTYLFLYLYLQLSATQRFTLRVQVQRLCNKATLELTSSQSSEMQ